MCGRRVAGHGDVLLDLIELGEPDGWDGVLLAVDGLLLEGREDLAEGHRRGVGAHGPEGLQMDRVLHGADLEALEVRWALHGVGTVGQLAEAVFIVGQKLDPLGFQGGGQLRADRAVEDGVGRLLVGDGEGQVEDVELRHQAVNGEAEVVTISRVPIRTASVARTSSPNWELA